MSLQGTLGGVQKRILQQEQQEIPHKRQAQRKNPAISPALPKSSLEPSMRTHEMSHMLLGACSGNSMGEDPAPPSQKQRTA